MIDAVDGDVYGIEPVIDVRYCHRCVALIMYVLFGLIRNFHA
ncbi:MAG: hypothetical protein ACP5NQ_02210 [Vulcanisaeta sp.]